MTMPKTTGTRCSKCIWALPKSVMMAWEIMSSMKAKAFLVKENVDMSITNVDILGIGVDMPEKGGGPKQYLSSNSWAFFSSPTTGDLRTATRASHVGGGSVLFSHLVSEDCRHSRGLPLMASRSEGGTPSPNPMTFHLFLTSYSSFKRSQSKSIFKAVPFVVYGQHHNSNASPESDLHASAWIPAILSWLASFDQAISGRRKLALHWNVRARIWRVPFLLYFIQVNKKFMNFEV